MANFTALKTAINNAIKTNGNEEITGAILQAILDAMVETLGDSAINDLENAITTEVTNRENAVGGVADDLAAEALARANKDNQLDSRINQEESNRQNADAALSQTMSQGFQTLGSQMTALNAAISALNAAYQNGYLYGGIATPSSSPSNNKCFYIALQGGTYTNFGGVGVVEGINIIKNDSGWKVEHIYDQTTLLNEFYLLRQQVIRAISSIDPIVIQGDVTNAPDEEDLTSDAQHLLKFKDRAYSPLNFSGLGMKILRKNIAPLSDSAAFNGFIEGVTAEETLAGTPELIFWDRMNTRFIGIKDGIYYAAWTDDDNYVPASTSLVYMYNGIPYQWTGSDFIVDETEVPNLVNCLTQDMINEANTIYIIRYDYTLKEDITIPANCVLQFDGGSISGNNTITYNETTLSGIVNVSANVSGTFYDVNNGMEQIFIALGGVFDSVSDAQRSINTEVIGKLYSMFNAIEFTQKRSVRCLNLSIALKNNAKIKNVEFNLKYTEQKDGVFTLNNGRADYLKLENLTFGIPDSSSKEYCPYCLKFANHTNSYYAPYIWLNNIIFGQFKFPVYLFTWLGNIGYLEFYETDYTLILKGTTTTIRSCYAVRPKYGYIFGCNVQEDETVVASGAYMRGLIVDNLSLDNSSQNVLTEFLVGVGLAINAQIRNYSNEGTSIKDVIYNYTTGSRTLWIDTILIDGSYTGKFLNGNGKINLICKNIYGDNAKSNLGGLESGTIMYLGNDEKTSNANGGNTYSNRKIVVPEIDGNNGLLRYTFKNADGGTSSVAEVFTQKDKFGGLSGKEGIRITLGSKRNPAATQSADSSFLAGTIKIFCCDAYMNEVTRKPFIYHFCVNIGTYVQGSTNTTGKIVIGNNKYFDFYYDTTGTFPAIIIKSSALTTVQNYVFLMEIIGGYTSMEIIDYTDNDMSSFTKLSIASPDSLSYSEGQLPSTGNLIGSSAFNETTKKPVWWDGTKWVYADGTAVS